MSGDRDHPTILVVDDNPRNLGVLFQYLRDHHFKVLIAADGESAIEQARYARPDIILLDVVMPGLDGFETCRRLVANPDTGSIPVIMMTALTDTSHKVEGFRAGAVDYVDKPIHHEEILARVNTHLRLRNLQKHLERKNDELDAFVRTVAHDLKDPLNQIVGLSHVLAEADLADRAREDVRAIQRIGHRMSDIISALLLLARVRDARVLTQAVDMNAVVAAARERLAHLIAERSAEITVAAALPPALAYGPWVEEVWANYLSNALKYGGDPPCIEIGADDHGDQVRYWVRDHGPGISADEQSQLFAEFTQLRGGIGHGLGLSIVRRIIEKLDGQLGVESQPGRGSTFYFILDGAGE